MGQKQNPIGLRLGIVHTSPSVWYAPKGKTYIHNIMNDASIREFIQKRYEQAGIESIAIVRSAQSVQVTISSSRPGVIIGKKGSDVDKLKFLLSKIAGVPANVTIQEYKKPDLSAKLVSENIAMQLRRRIQFRKAMKRAVQSTMRAGAKGVKIIVSGRLNGAEIARSESYHEGRVPLHTFRANIDYYIATAKTTYGILGVKVWIFRDDVAGKQVKKKDEGV